MQKQKVILVTSKREPIYFVYKYPYKDEDSIDVLTLELLDAELGENPRKALVEYAEDYYDVVDVVVQEDYEDSLNTYNY